MKKKDITCILILLALVSCAETNNNIHSDWNNSLYMSNNDYWRQRIPVNIQNNLDRELAGDPVVLPVGKGKGEIPLAGEQAEGIRVVTAGGTELTFRLTDHDGNIVEKGLIPSDGKLVIPVECDKQSLATQYIYFDNPSAWPIGDFYKTHREITNGSFEAETIYGPTGWKISLPEDNNRVEQVKGEAHSGNKSICIDVETDTKTEYFGASQVYLHIFSGAKYTIEGWVKGENITGDVQLAVVFGNLNTEDFKLGSEQISAGNGTFDWKKITFEFIAPDNVSGATLFLSLNGTGKAWFDDLQITCNQEYNVVAEAQKKEKIILTEKDNTADWYETSDWPSRTVTKVFNFEADDISGKLVCVDIEEVVNRLHAEVNENSAIQVTNGTTALPFYKAGDYIMFKQDLKSLTEQINYVYFSPDGQKVKSLVVSDIGELNPNLINNPDFEANDLSGWHGDIENKLVSVVDVYKTGAKGVQLTVDESVKEVKIEQILPVEAGITYFFSTWMKCTDIIKQPDFLAGISQRTLRAQFVDDNGRDVGTLKRIAVNPERHIDNAWSQLYMLITAPEGAKSVKIQLVNGAPGTVWFDDIIFTDVITATTSPLAIERLGAKDIKELAVWQEDPIVKVFPDDLPGQKISDANISLARNEVEPLQLVVRSPKEYKHLEIKVVPPSDNNGHTLENIDIGVVGYIPINYPSNYISDRTRTYWQQKVPFGRIGSDGWRGYWPDPILPFDHFDLPANTSTPIWIEIKTPVDAVAGNYSGKVQLLNGGAVIKEVPFGVHVWDFALPDDSHVIAEYDARTGPSNFFGNAKSQNETTKEIWAIMKEHRTHPDCVAPEAKWRIENGRIVFDFTEFDKAADYYFNTLKLQRMYSPWYFYLFGWANLPPEKFGEKPYPGEFPYPGVDRSKLRPEYINAYQSALRTYWNHLKEKGWEDKFILYISDEPHADAEITQQMRAVCDMIHAVDPKIPIYVSTWWYRPEYKGYVDVWGVSNHGGGWGRPVPVSDLVQIKRIGGRLWFTTDGKMCTDTPFLGFERLLPYYCFKYGAEEYEFWGSNWYTFNPYEYGWHAFIRQSDRPGDLYWIRYPNGDANFIYPGLPIGVDKMIPTIRLKLAREGVEDYEYFYYLNALITQAKKQGKDVSEAENALKEALNIIAIPSSEGRYSTEYLPDPYIVMRVRNKVGDAIEKIIKNYNHE